MDGQKFVKTNILQNWSKMHFPKMTRQYYRKLGLVMDSNAITDSMLLEPPISNGSCCSYGRFPLISKI